MTLALLAAAAGADGAQTTPAKKRPPAPPAVERVEPDQGKQPVKTEPSVEERKLNDPEAQYQLGEKYLASDRPTALMWYVRAADQGHKGAIARVTELTKRYEPPAPAEPVAPPASEREAPVPSRSSRENIALAVSVLALAVSAMAIVFSWTRTRKALRDAGLL